MIQDCLDGTLGTVWQFSRALHERATYALSFAKDSEGKSSPKIPVLYISEEISNN